MCNDNVVRIIKYQLGRKRHHLMGWQISHFLTLFYHPLLNAHLWFELLTIVPQVAAVVIWISFWVGICQTQPKYIAILTICSMDSALNSHGPQLLVSALTVRVWALMLEENLEGNVSILVWCALEIYQHFTLIWLKNITILCSDF